MSRRTLLCCLLLAGLCGAPSLHAVAGKWTPEQLLEHDHAWLRELGLEVTPETLWNPQAGSLLEAVVKIGGCSSGFISSSGLLITNHHCLFSLLQLHSSPERDLIRDGFLATSREEELSGGALRATVPHRFTDVSAEIEAAVPAGADDLQRYHAIDRKKKELVAACEAEAFRRCQVAVYDDGVRYTLVEALEFPDVRLVYAPPRAVGEFGGEVDNWMWPRHTGDFAMARVYARDGRDPAPYSSENRPFQPRQVLPVAPAGVRAESFVMVVGYPGRTYRSLIAAEMAVRRDRYFPSLSALYRDWMEILEAEGAGNEAARIAVAGRLKGLSNREKNARGQIVGFRRGDLLEKKQAAEEVVLAWAEGRADHGAAVAAYRELEALQAARLQTWERDFLLDQAKRNSTALDLALDISRWALEGEKADLERDADYQERNRDRARQELKDNQKRLHRSAEEKLMADLLARFARLPEGQRLPALEVLSAGATTPEALLAVTQRIFADTAVLDLDTRLAMFEEDLATLRHRNDPLLTLAFVLNKAILEMEEQEKRQEGAISRLRPTWRRAVVAHAGKPVAPDANGTLRVSLAKVRGYRPRDGIWMEPQTRLGGVLEKYTGEYPFDVPADVRAAAASAAASRWADPVLQDVPVCFLADGDTTGGNSGSPVLNGRGELVGVNFDRVWENVANDFGYNPEIARNVNSDLRYLLWILETFEGAAARPLLEEMGLPPR